MIVLMRNSKRLALYLFTCFTLCMTPFPIFAQSACDEMIADLFEVDRNDPTIFHRDPFHPRGKHGPWNVKPLQGNKNWSHSHMDDLVFWMDNHGPHGSRQLRYMRSDGRPLSLNEELGIREALGKWNDELPLDERLMAKYFDEAATRARQIAKMRRHRAGFLLNPFAKNRSPRPSSAKLPGIRLPANLGTATSACSAFAGLMAEDNNHGRDMVGRALAELRDSYPLQGEGFNPRINQLEDFVNQWGGDNWPIASPGNLNELISLWEDRDGFDAVSGLQGFFDWAHSKPLSEVFPPGLYQSILGRPSLGEIQVIRQ